MVHFFYFFSLFLSRLLAFRVRYFGEALTGNLPTSTRLTLLTGCATLQIVGSGLAAARDMAQQQHSRQPARMNPPPTTTALARCSSIAEPRHVSGASEARWLRTGGFRETRRGCSNARVMPEGETWERRRPSRVDRSPLPYLHDKVPTSLGS